MDLTFLSSNRFWALIGLVIIMVLQSYQIIPNELALGLETLFGGFIGVRTIDRATEVLGNK